MALRAEELRTDLIEQVLERVRDRLEASRRERAQCFVRQFYANVPLDDIEQESPDNLYGAALALLGISQKRAKGEAKIRVYNPHLEEQGWKSPHTVVEIVNDDMPFLVDSVTAQLNLLETEVSLVIHPIFRVARDAQGKMTDMQPRGGEIGQAESFMHVQINEQPAEQHRVIREALTKVLADVRAAVEDWQSMRERCDSLIGQLEENPPPLPAEEIASGIEFLKWLNDNHFTHLGYRHYTFEGKGEKAVTRVPSEGGLGVLRDPSVSVFEGLRNLGQLPAEVRAFLKQPQLLRINKANRRATVHRAVHMDAIAVKDFDAKGKVIGERLFIGLFTSGAYSRNPREIPLLREKVKRTVASAGFPPQSHDGKALTHILDNYPRDELFQIGDDELLGTALGILHLQDRQRTALFVPARSFRTLRFGPGLRAEGPLRHQSAVEDPRCSSARLRRHGCGLLYPLDGLSAGPPPYHRAYQAGRGSRRRCRGAGAQDRRGCALLDGSLARIPCRCPGRGAGHTPVASLCPGFPAGYTDSFDAQNAVFDIARIEEALAKGRLAMNLYRPIESGEHQLRFKIYVPGEPVPLSDVLPMLENMGLRVIGEVPYEVHLPDDDKGVWIHDFETVTEDGAAIELPSVKALFHEAFAQVWGGEMENDGFNKLVLRSGLSAREVKVLRSYCKYLRQAGIPFSQTYMEETLKRNPQITRRLVDLFVRRFDARHAEDGDDSAQDLISGINVLLEDVSNLDEDRIIRRFLNVIEATLRTNFFQPDDAGREKSYISFKLNSQAIDELPLPRPFREIFVYSPRVEGVHLRFGKVARGGLRWSDRREDFRTEILGLVKAQQVKNAVIVPVGSKGGFVVKRPPAPEAGRQAFLDEGIECYKTFIRGLLDLTDNLKGQDVIPPVQVVRRDNDDPYLVVAADKGTATFSDIANGVSLDYGFWLDDAFASGGSAGYDHKKMGITARGAWESVKRHFREIGKDIQNDDFTCIGVGDMSGDVFGNGMLLSKHIKLLAAFNHMHIFIDPDPDPAKSWKERQRMFDLPRSAWTDYDAKLISKGGGLFDRKAKSINLSPEIKALLGVKVDRLTPNELITLLLKAKVELLWFGGIGTYAKASHETHADAGDRANDAIRINAKEIGAQVIGEGANLGVTQNARIEFGLAGGRCNTDSIDNSAGVDCSDHEVNIKILLGGVEEAGDMTRKQRDVLLAKMTDEVADLVLRDNYLQTQAITVTHQLGVHLVDRTARFMRSLERADQLNRAVEHLPDDETITDRLKQGQGFARSELAVLLSYAKIVLYDELLASDLPDDGYLADSLADYFPTPLRSKYRAVIDKHRLRREIVATVVTNELVNRVGLALRPRGARENRHAARRRRSCLHDQP